MRDKAPILIIAILTIAVFVVIVVAAGKSEQTDIASTNVDPSIFLTEGSHIRGEASASATLVEFSDFQCPACASFYPIVKQLESDSQGKLKVVYKHYPLPQHKFAQKAAEAAEAASAQGKFWEYHDMLFENQNDFSLENFKKFAGELGLDQAQFDADFDSAKYAGFVRGDIELGTKLSIDSTPTFYLNGKKLLLRTSDDLKREIDAVVNSN